MALPTGYMTNEDFQFWLATVETPGAGDWDDVSNEIISAGPVTGGARTRVETNVYGEETPIVTVGRRAASEMPLTIVYIETASSLWDKLKDAYEDKTKVWLRFAPLGTGAGHQAFQGYGNVLAPLTPGGAASDTGVAQCSTSIAAPSFDPVTLT